MEASKNGTEKQKRNNSKKIKQSKGHEKGRTIKTKQRSKEVN